MNIDNFMDLISGSAVQRWHTRVTLKQQNNAEHQWRVAIIAQMIEPSISKATLLYALTHDCFEHLTGDMPYNAKIDNPALGFQMKGAEKHFSEQLNLPSADVDEYNVVKAADRLCAMLFATQEFYLGNLKMAEVSERIYNDLHKNEIVLKEKQQDRLEKLSSIILNEFLGEQK